MKSVHLCRSVLVVGTALSLALAATPTALAAPISHSAADAALELTAIGTYETGIFDKSAAEIVSYHPASRRALVVNASSGRIDVLDIADPTAPVKLHEVAAGEDTTINSVAVRPDGLAVATVEPSDKTDTGHVIVWDAAGDGSIITTVPVGSLPDMITITEDGRYALVANEGEPAEDYSVDPEGSVSIIELPENLAGVDNLNVRTAGFEAFNSPGALPEGVRIFGQVGASTTVAQNLEPEYIATSGGKAYVSLQENNAIAVVDIASATVERIFPLGTVDLNVVPMDVSDRDGRINITNWPIKSFLMPDSIETFQASGHTYLLTANEGDARDWEAYSEEARLKNLGKKGLPDLCEGYGGLDAEGIAALKSDEQAGRLKITLADGLNVENNCYEQIYAFGGRGFSIFDTQGNRVFNSDAQFETILAEANPEFFNSNHRGSDFDGRSDDKGPEPEGVAVGVIGERTYAFIGLERVGGVMVYDISTPAAAKYVTYLNNRDFAYSVEEDEASLGQAGDLGPEGLFFVPAAQSPNGKDLLLVGNEVSGTTTIFEITGDSTPAPTPAPVDSAQGSSLGVFAGIAAVLAALGAFLAPQILPRVLPQLHALFEQHRPW